MAERRRTQRDDDVPAPAVEQPPGPAVGAARLRLRQAHEALAIANERKAEQRDLRQEIKGGKVDVPALIRGHDETPIHDTTREEVVKRMRLRVILRAVPGVGHVLMHQIVSAFDASPDDFLGSFTYEQRAELARTLQALTGRRS